MFQKPAFGANTSGFGMQSSFGSSAATTASPFGSFKPPTATSAFGAPPAFGASTSTQPATGGGLFGSTNTTGGLFGTSTSAAPAPAFGASTSFAFGGNTSGGLFGSNNTSTGLFGGTQANAGFGAKPAGFGFGSTPTNTSSGGGLFGTTSTPGSGLFGQQGSTLAGGGGLFSNTAGGFGAAAPASGSAHVKYNPVVGTDVIVKSGSSQNINIKHHCITCMKEYEGKSLEELRLEDYTAGRKGSSAGVFAFQQQENKPLFPQPTAGFGQAATTTAPSVFGGGGGFGQTNAFSFGAPTATNTNTTGLFGAAKPAFGAQPTTGSGLFGGTATTQAPAFGTNTSTFGFGTNLQNQSSGGLFGAKPATSVFGAAPASSGFGSFGGAPALFQAKPLQTQAPTFGPAAGVGTMAGGFGTAITSTSGLFGGNTAFGKPTTTTPAFGFSQPTVGLNTGLGANTFQAKPTTGFGTLGGGMFNQQPASNTFRTGLESGLGGGIFGNSSALGGASLGLGLNANNSALTNPGGAGAAGSVHDQILTLAARPYGDSPLFKDLLPDSSTTAEDVLKPTNPSAVSAVLERCAYRVSPAGGSRLQTRDRGHHTDRKSLFDGLEESDPSLEDKLTLKPSRKRLVLRPKPQLEQDYNHNNRSQEDNPCNDLTNGEQTDKENSQRIDEIERARKNLDFPDGNTSNSLEISKERQGSWLSSSNLPWSEKEKPIDNEPTPRLYPNLDKELPADSDRRASWLTTKPLRKPLASAVDQENSVQELGVRTSHVYSHVSQDKENVDTLSVSSDSPPPPQESPPHPTGVRCTRPGYYTIPSLDEMINYMRSDGSCVVPHLTIGRTNYGNVYYDAEIDVAGLDLDSLVHFLNKEVIIYPEDGDKPPVGSALNRRAVVTLDRVWPRDKTDRTHIADPDRLLKMDYEGKLRRVCEKHDTKFIEYRPQTGSWVFRVEHFSKYGLTDSDEEDDVTPDVLKRQLVNQSLQKNAAPANIPPLAPVVGLGGLGLGGLTVGGLTNMGSMAGGPLDARSVLTLGALPGFEMDTTEDNTESQSLYQDNKAFGVKSPTTELARLENRQSHHVQLMKASLYADAGMDDDVSVSTDDQLVPLARSAQQEAGALMMEHAPSIPLMQQDDDAVDDVQLELEPQLRPLIVKPHTVVLKYHRKIPPFKHTIAGRLGAGCIGDMSVCRARHARAGFGPGPSVAYVSTFHSLADNERDADLSELNRYVSGRGDNDWSEPIVARLAVNEPDLTFDIPEFLSRNLVVLHKYSSLVPGAGGAGAGAACPRLQLSQAPAERRRALHDLIGIAASVRDSTPKFGVSGAYCHQVFKLCDALWGEDLENDGIPGTDNLSIVTRYRKFLAWLTEATAEETDRELAKPIQPEKEDEGDHHSARIWTLLLGGRLLDACKLAKENGDLNMAALMAQAAGEPSFRSLISRQLSVYRECGASSTISAHKLAALELISGTAPTQQVIDAHWLCALHATARYLCTQVPSLEQILTKYTQLFSSDVECGDLSRVAADPMGMNLPLPTYCERLDVNSEQAARRPLDLRYELVRARALNARPALAPQHYTEDPFDYSLCAILGLWFGSYSPQCIAHAAEQLQPRSWHHAVLLLMYLQDDRLRARLIQDVLSRHVPAKVDPEVRARLDFIKKLGVPDKWVYLAQAHRAKYEHLPQLEAEYLVGAEQWNAAHKVLIDDLLPNAVLSDNLQSITGLLEKLNEAAKRHEIHGWEVGGRALYNYIHVCSEIRSLVRHGGDVPGRLEALRPAVAAAVHATTHLPTQSALGVAGRVELAARALGLLRAAGAGCAAAAAALHACRLPPDTEHATHRQITMDLAEQASELCIESATSSPVSSHHRATAAS